MPTWESTLPANTLEKEIKTRPLTQCKALFRLLYANYRTVMSNKMELKDSYEIDFDLYTKHFKPQKKLKYQQKTI